MSSDERDAACEKYGFYSASWVSFLRDFASAEKYKQRVLNFLIWANRRNVEPAGLTLSLIDYFDARHKETVGDGDPDLRYAGTTLRGWLSIFSKFWKYSGKGDLKKDAAVIEDNISKWEKNQVVDKANTFEMDDLGFFSFL